MQQKRICLQPFDWLELHPDGSLFGCCPSWRPQPLGNLLDQSLEDIWHGEHACRLRAALAQGQFPGCRSSRCPHLASGSGPVRYQQQLTAAERHLLDPTGAGVGKGPGQFKLSFDPRCNLACPSCRSEEWLPGFDAGREKELRQRVVDDILPRARTLVFAGHGDPFAAPGYTELLQALEEGAAPALEALHLHTNGQLWTRRRWSAFPRLQAFLRFAEISVDAASAETYALNRRGGSFSRLLETLAFVSELAVEVQLSCVVQANNLHELEAFCALADRFGFRGYFSKLDNWGSFSREEYARRAVHLTGHPRHKELLERLRRLTLHPRVSLGNLASLVATAR